MGRETMMTCNKSLQLELNCSLCNMSLNQSATGMHQDFFN